MRLFVGSTHSDWIWSEMESLGVDLVMQYLFGGVSKWGRRQMVQAPERFEAGRSFVADVVHLGHGAFAQVA